MAKIIDGYLLSAAFVNMCEIYMNYAFILPKLQKEPENARPDFVGLCTRHGLRPIKYNVTTEDGYILTLFRVPGKSKYPVMLMHGALDTSDTWLLRGVNSLGVTLANDGYDLWFPNSRGNRYSRGHVYLDSDKNASYWNWSLHELRYYDLPAVVDTILNVTQAASLSAIGHSRGNHIFYVLGATRPEYNKKINVMIALAPVCYFRHSEPPLATLLKILPALDILFKILDIEVTEIFGYNSTATRMIREFCTYPVIGNELCLNAIIFPAVGFDPEEIDPSFVNVFIYHAPTGTSWKDFLHYAQIRNRGEFAQYDHGTAKNLQAYNSTLPPRYNLNQVTMPVALLAGKNDPLSKVSDVQLLRDQLPNVVDCTVNTRALLCHIDHVWGKTMHHYLFPDIYKGLKRYNNV